MKFVDDEEADRDSIRELAALNDNESDTEEAPDAFDGPITQPLRIGESGHLRPV